MTREIGLYIHIPFCVRKCAYCDFSSFPRREGDMPAYVDAVIKEAERRPMPDAVIATMYLGGGTPSLLPPALMDRLLRAIRSRYAFLPGAECTCECNPGTVTAECLAVLKENGVNRLSLGAQAYQGRLLRLLGRIHTWNQVESSMKMARQAGFDNLNLDMMLGLPTQTPQDVRDTLRAVLALAPTHVSCYGLIVEKGTPLKANVDAGLWELPHEDAERDMYEDCRSTLSHHGFVQYEISNFARPGFSCRHNVDCWQRKEYLGLGCAACGFLGNVRRQNPPSLDDYLKGCPAEETVISPEEARFESMMLGLRLTEGVSEDAFFRMHGISLRDAFGSRLARPLAQGLVVFENGFLRLTRRGMDVQNRVLVELL